MNSNTNQNSYKSVKFNGKTYTAFMIDEYTAVFFGGSIPKLKTDKVITEEMMIAHIAKNS